MRSTKPAGVSTTQLLAVALSLALVQLVFLTDVVESEESRFLAALMKKPKKCSKNVVCGASPEGPDCCGGSCVDTSTDDYNCGKCGFVCKFTQSCCAGKCYNLNYDKRHCGVCDNKCPHGVLCIYGMCNYAL